MGEKGIVTAGMLALETASLTVQASHHGTACATKWSGLGSQVLVVDLAAFLVPASILCKPNENINSRQKATKWHRIVPRVKRPFPSSAGRSRSRVFWTIWFQGSMAEVDALALLA